MYCIDERAILASGSVISPLVRFLPTYFASLGGQDCFQCGRPVRLYADGGTTVMLRTDRDAPSGTGISRMTLSGHLIDTP
jgi:hypothetical protein